MVLKMCLILRWCCTSSNNIVILDLRLFFFISGQYLKHGLTHSIQIWHVDVSSPKGSPYFKVTLHSQMKKELS